MNPGTVPERSRETKEKLNDNSSNILVELSKLLKQSNKNSGSQEVCWQTDCCKNKSYRKWLNSVSIVKALVCT